MVWYMVRACHVRLYEAIPTTTVDAQTPLSTLWFFPLYEVLIGIERLFSAFVFSLHDWVFFLSFLSRDSRYVSSRAG